jgi:catechol 2,3-dioxygenase-like lactoylglutathione lyase family enzyme
MDLGWFELALNVRNLERALAFYDNLGFRRVAGSLENRAIVIQSGDCRIALYEGHISENLINLRGGDLRMIAASLADRGLPFEKGPFVGDDGSAAALLRDPDGNAIYFVTHPGEKKQGPS